MIFPMVNYYTELSLKYPLLISIFQLIIVYYLFSLCKKNINKFSWYDLGESRSFILNCGLLMMLLMDSIFLLFDYFND